MKPDRTQGLVTGKIDLPLIHTVYASAEQAITANTTYTDINSMTITFTVPVGNAKLLCYYTHRIKMDSAHWEHHNLVFVLDGSATDQWLESRDTNPPSTTQVWVRSFHAVMSNIAAGEHTVKVQHYTPSDLNVKIYHRRLTVMIGR